MEKILFQAYTGKDYEVTIDNKIYDIKLTSYENVDGYAKILVIDRDTEERYLSNGYIEINNRVIISKWKREYSLERENWICTRDLVLYVQ